MKPPPASTNQAHDGALAKNARATNDVASTSRCGSDAARQRLNDEAFQTNHGGSPGASEQPGETTCESPAVHEHAGRRPPPQIGALFRLASPCRDGLSNKSNGNTHSVSDRMVAVLYLLGLLLSAC